MVERRGVVVYTDATGVEHQALVTEVHGEPERNPAINLVYVQPDEGMRDQYGLQLLRETSIVHQSNQSARGRFWREP
jgi:hypothetical protein